MFKNLLKSTATRFGDSMQNFANGIQLTDGKSSGVTYVESNISNQEMSAAYSSSWIAAKVIDKPIEDAFRAWREWVAGDPKQVTAIVCAISGHSMRLKVLGVLFSDTLFSIIVLFSNVVCTPNSL